MHLSSTRSIVFGFSLSVGLNGLFAPVGESDPPYAPFNLVS